jgi:hypothetical protein
MNLDKVALYNHIIAQNTLPGVETPFREALRRQEDTAMFGVPVKYVAEYDPAVYVLFIR